MNKSDNSSNKANQPPLAEPSANTTRPRGRPRRNVVARTSFDATPAQCQSSAPIIASDTLNKRGPKRKEQVVGGRDSTEGTEIVDRELGAISPKRSNLEPAPSSSSATSQSSAALSSGAPLRVTPLTPVRAPTSGQSISHSSLGRDSTSKSETAYKPPVDVRARSRPCDVLAALRGSPLPDLVGTRTAPRPAAPPTAVSPTFQFASGVGARGTVAQASSTTAAVARRSGLQQVGNKPGIEQKKSFATKHLAEYVAKNASQRDAVMSVKKVAEQQGDHQNVSLEQHGTDDMECQPHNTEEGESRRVNNVLLNDNIKCDVDDDELMVIDEKLATGNVSTHHVEPVTARVKQQYPRRSYPFTQSSHQLMSQLGNNPEVQHENKPARSSLITNFIQNTSELRAFENVCMTQEDLMDVKLGKIETQPLQALKFNCPFDMPRVNYFKVKNISEHRIGIMINVSSCDRIDLDTQLACLSPLESITIKVTTRSFELKEYTKDYIAIEWMNVLDTTVLTNEWFHGDGPRNKKTLIVEYSL